MADKNIIIDIPFNIDLTPYMLPKNYIHIKLRKSFIEAQTRKWLERRIGLFMKYTGNSLIHQTDQNYRCLLRCTVETKEVIDELLQAYPPLPSNIIFTADAQQIIEDSIIQSGNLCRVVIDSDNMFHSEAISDIRQYPAKKETQTLIFKEGYAYDEASKRVIRIFHPSPSFYAVLYDLSSYRTLYSKRLFEKHWDAVKYPYETLEGPRYCICTHDMNVDNTFLKLRYRYMVSELQEEEKEKFLREWYINE